MNIFGLSVTRAVRPVASPAWGGFGSGRGWWPLIVRDQYAGAWQRNDELRLEDWLSYWPVYRCIELISTDVAKMRLKLVSEKPDGIWEEVESPAFSPVLRKPNGYQNRIQFITCWVQSKLIHGNTFVLKERDQRGVVVHMHVLDPCRVTTLVTPDGEVYYEMMRDDLAGQPGAENVVVPARDLIHDRQNTFYHPLVGLSKRYAAGLAAQQGLSIQGNEVQFFSNGSRPGGILTAPGAIADDTATRIKDVWDTNYSGANVGKVAVLGDGLKYEPMATKAIDAQLLEQLKFSAEMICGVFGVPPYKLGLGAVPTANNVEALDRQYYTQCLQQFIESIEKCLDEGLELPSPYGTEFELDDLLRMDTATLIKALTEAVGAGIMTPNEARFRLNLGPKQGGDTPYLQQQNFSLTALDKRDRDDPFAKPEPAPAAAVAPPANDDNAAVKDFTLAMLRGLR